MSFSETTWGYSTAVCLALAVSLSATLSVWMSPSLPQSALSNCVNLFDTLFSLYKLFGFDFMSNAITRERSEAAAEQNIYNWSITREKRKEQLHRRRSNTFVLRKRQLGEKPDSVTIDTRIQSPKVVKVTVKLSCVVIFCFGFCVW